MKKKFKDREVLSRNFLSQLFLIMKLTLFFLITSVLGLFATESYSQMTRITLDLKSVTVKNALKAIENESEFFFIYNNELIDVDRAIDISVKNQKITEVLNAIFEGRNVEITVIDRKIVLAPAFMGEQQPGKKITGKVTDSSGASLPGVSVVIKGTTIGSITDADGNYSLGAIPQNAILQFSFVGMKTQEIAIGGKASINVTLVDETIGIEEVVAVGYGTQKKLSVSGAISTLNPEIVRDVTVSNLTNALAGRISGVYVNQVSGIPGYAADIRIRGINTWKNSGKDVLFVIDGVIADKKSFDALDVNEIENVSVLKDAASGAIYGARAANGVIIVTTKEGKKGVFKLNYSYSNSIDKRAFIPEFQSIPDMVSLMNYQRKYEGATPFFDSEEIAYFQNNDPGSSWMKYGYKDPTTQKHSLSASGGNDRIKYFVGSSYFDQKAFIDNTLFNKLNLRTKLDINFTNNLSGTFNFSYSDAKQIRPTREDGDNTFSTVYMTLLEYDPFTPAYTSDGKLVNTLYLRGNTIGHIKEGGLTTQHDYQIDLLTGLTYKVPFVDGLSVSAKYSLNPNITSVKRQDKKHTVYNVVRKGSHGLIFTDEVISSELSGYPTTEKLEYSYNIARSYQLNLSANYNKSFGKHGLDAVFVYEKSEGDNVYTLAQRFDYPLLRKDQIWATGSSRLQGAVDGNESQNGRSSYIGRAVYNYGEKYFVNLTARYDGSMLFAPGYRWGFFPSVSASWALSKEDFFKVDFINFLKIRSAWGNSGNDAVGGWAWSESFSNVGSYLLSSLQPMVRYSGIVNKVLTWEKTREWNIGFDSKLFKGCMLNLDYYFKHNYDILDTRIVSLPISFGGSMPPENYGIVDAHGIEVELGYTGKVGEVNFGVVGNFAYSTNEVKLRDVAQNVRKVDNPNGRPTDYIKTLVATGILRTQADLDALPKGYTINGLKPRLGMLNYQDVSGPTEGVPDGIISSYDSQVLTGKHSNPPYMFGLNLNADWKGLGIDLFFQGAAGVWKTRSDRAFAESPIIRNYKYWEDMWTPENPNAKYPMGVGTGTYNATNWIGSDFWIENASYLRLQQLNLRYTLPKNITNKLRLPNDITLNLSGTNLLTFTGFHAYDVTSTRPETYPIMKSYTMGINVTF